MLALAAALLAFPLAQDEPLLLPEHGLTIELDGPEKLTVRETSASGQRRRLWTGKLGHAGLTIEFFLLEHDEYGLDTPEDVVELIAYNRAQNTTAGEVAFAFEETRGIEGAFGFVPYVWAGVQTSHEGTMPTGNVVCLGGIARGAAWTLEVDAKPALSEKDTELLIDMLTAAVVYEGETHVIEWEDEEVATLWQENAPDRVLEQGDLNILRTDHYLIMTDMRTKGGTGKKLAKMMEERYDEIRELYPFEEVEGRRLMPIFIFRARESYQGFLVKALGMSEEQARRTGGIAYGPFYATSYQDPGAPVHIHEMTHQIFRNRLRLAGGGSWFQEGVAEYIEGKKNDRNTFENIAKKETHLPLKELFQKQSLIFSTEVDKKHGDQAGDLYLQCACVIEFLHKGKFGKGKFQAFLHAVGSVRRNDLVAIEDALGRVYGVDIDGFEAEFLKYWKKR